MCTLPGISTFLCTRKNKGESTALFLRRRVQYNFVTFKKAEVEDSANAASEKEIGHDSCLFQINTAWLYVDISTVSSL